MAEKLAIITSKSTLDWAYPEMLENLLNAAHYQASLSLH